MRLWPASPINPTLLSTRPPMNSAAMTIAFNPRARCKRDRRWVYVASPVIRLVSHERVSAASFAEQGNFAGLEGYPLIVMIHISLDHRNALVRMPGTRSHKT